MIDSSRLKNFAQDARRQLMDEVRVKLDLALNPSSTLAMENREAVAKLKNEIDSKNRTKEELIEEVAYTWFNRIIALRYMDSRGLQNPMAVTPLEGQSLPEMLTIAKSLDFSVFSLSFAKQEQIKNLVLGNTQSSNAQEEIYRILFLSVCNDCSSYMPEVFEWVGNYTEVLLPDNLLSDNSVLMKATKAITDEDCENGNIIGWMYQYYISEKKDEVMASKKKYGRDEIPAATQLFTPEWIVRYLVQNSIGRLWMLNNPNSSLKSEMEYYVEPVEPETDFIKLSSPEDFKVFDPCCGSGHMLTYAFDLLYKIYEECGYTSIDAVESIIKNNLFGIEIDKRAGQLSYFALLMKASEKNRRFLRNKSKVRPNICILKNEHFSDEEIKQLEELFKGTLPINFADVMNQFEHADVLGSLITPCISDISTLESTLEKKKESNDLFDTDASIVERTEKVFTQTKYLSKRYNIIITNPPYFSPSDAEPIMQNFAKYQFPDSKKDVGTMFIERNLKYIPANGYVAMITLQSWMFSTKYSKLRKKLLNYSFCSLIQIGARGFDSIGGEVVTTACYIIYGKSGSNKFTCLDLTDGNNENSKMEALYAALKSNNCKNKYIACLSSFEALPNNIFAYWLSTHVTNLMANAEKLSEVGESRQGITTSDNNRFVRMWQEVSFGKINFNCLNRHDAQLSNSKWFPLIKGGDYRKWYGNQVLIVDCKNDGEEIKKLVLQKYPYLDSPDFVVKNQDYYFQAGITWNDVSTGFFCARLVSNGFIFADAGPMYFSQVSSEALLGYFNSNTFQLLANAVCQGLHYSTGDIPLIPFIEFDSSKTINIVSLLKKISKRDWDSFETSWDFKRHPLV